MYNYLFDPIKINGIELKNRIVFTSIGIDSYNDEGTVTDENISFVKARSIETGMIITTVSMATYKYGGVKFIGSYDDFFIPSLSKLAQAGHWGGARIILQISAMGGPNTLADDVFHNIIPYVPSADIADYKGEWTGKNKPTELTTEQIEEIIDDFIKAALRAKEAGFDGVELFAAEDFLLSSFITPHFNRRTDRYGGSFENMLRMPVEIIRGIKKVCGRDFIIGFKYNAYYEFPEGDGINLDLGVKIGKRLSEENVSYLHAYSYAKHNRPFSLFKFSIMPSQYQPRNTTIPISAMLKENIKNVPVMAVGGILKPDEADRIIAEEKADLISIGRAFIADHLWAYKAKRNQRIRPCIRCFVCLNEATKGRIIACSINPDVLVEEKKVLRKTKRPKKVMIIGGGPAGIVSALTASQRGHDVTLYEKRHNVGGELLTSSVKGLKYEFKDLLDYYRKELSESSVKVFKDTQVNGEQIIKEKPEVVIIAIGARYKVLDIEGINSENVLDASESILKAHKIHNKQVTIIGGGDCGCEAAVILNRNGNDVTIIEEKDKLMSDNDIEYLTMVLEKILVEEGVRFFLKFKVVKIENNKVIIENTINKNIFEIESDLIVNASGREIPVEEIKELSERYQHTHIIGDCLRPARLFQAVTEAFNVANAI